MSDNTKTSVLGNLIGSGEGGYYSFNRGVAGDSPGQQLDPNITVGEIIRRQQLSFVGPDQLFAVGKYQMIGPSRDDSVGTFQRAVTALGISPDEKFTPDLQERMFSNYLITSKRPEINEYITGVSQGTDGLQRAQVALAQEFASVGDPTKGGRSYYDNDSGGNKASISPEDAANALSQMRERYAANRQSGMSNTAAYDALRDQPVSQQTVSQSTGAPARDYLSQGDRGQRVETLQQALNAHGARLTVDGDFGNATRTAVENYQRANHLTVDGVAGREVFKSLGISNEQTQGATNAASLAALAGVQGLNAPGARDTVSGALASAAADVAKGAVKQNEPARDTGTDVAATAREWAGRNFKPGETERCQDFVNTMLNTTSPGLADKIGTTRRAVDGLESGENLASRFFGNDVSKPVTDLSQAKPGDIVGFTNTYGNFPPGTITHVGIYVGDGMIVDRPTSDRPVQMRSIHTFGENNFVIARPNAYEQVQSIKTGVDTPTQAPTTAPQTQSAAPGVDTSLIRQGDIGPNVEALQRQLQAKGFDPGQVDGQFGPRTEAAVKAFQTAHGLEVDGVVGQLTRGQLTQPVQVASQSTAPAATDQAQLAAQAITQGARPTLNVIEGMSAKPLINEPAHPDNALFRDALKGVEKLPATVVSTQDQAEKMAAAIVVAAKSANLGEIGGVVAHPNGGGVFAVDKKDFTDPAAKVVFVDAKQTELPLKDSSQTLDQMGKQQTAQQGNEPKPELERRGMMVA